MNNKRLYKSSVDRQISGVCGGLAEYFDVDSTLIRLIFVLFAVLGGPSIIVYIALALIMPEEPYQDAYTKEKRDDFESYTSG